MDKITFSGVVGSGKTTVAKRVAEKLGIEYRSMGVIQEEIAKRRGVSFNELSEIARTDKSVDEEIDRRQQEMNEDDSCFAMDSRLGFKYITNSYKVYLKVDIEEAARRIYTSNRSRQNYSSYEECLVGETQRIEDEVFRYRKKGIELQDESQFDLVIDTTHKGIEEVVEEVLSSIPN
jgi:cytidylate kinase